MPTAWSWRHSATRLHSWSTCSAWATSCSASPHSGVMSERCRISTGSQPLRTSSHHWADSAFQ